MTDFKRAGKIVYLEPEILTEKRITVHGFTTRHEGVSLPPYHSLNLGLNTGDNPSDILKNRRRLAETFGTDLSNLVTGRQVHGNDALVIDKPYPNLSHFLQLEYDALITNQPGIMIGVRTSDCVPILLLDPVRKVIAAVHAGWKGTVKKAVFHTIQKMCQIFGSNPAELLASIGPCIHKCCYEVDSDVRNAFLESGQNWDAFTIPGVADNKWMLELAEANRLQLYDAGLPENSIQVLHHCVHCDEDNFFSYRRNGLNTGRQMGFIKIRP